MGKKRITAGDIYLGQKIAEMRIEKDMKPKEFAKLVIGAATIKQVERYESGELVIPMRSLEKIFRFFDSHVDRKIWRKIGYERQERNPNEELLLEYYKQLFDE